MHAVDEAQVIGMFGQVWEQVRNPQAALPVLAESPGGRQQRHHLAGLMAVRLAGIGVQLRLVIEGVNVGWPAVHEQENHPFGSWGEVGHLRR
jgi:hypothetical protein